MFNIEDHFILYKTKCDLKEIIGNNLLRRSLLIYFQFILHKLFESSHHRFKMFTI